MKHFTLVIAFLAIFPTLTFGQTYYEQNKKCSEILDGIPIGNELFWRKLEERDSCFAKYYHR